jgi:hypothetical protein
MKESGGILIERLEFEKKIFLLSKCVFKNVECIFSGEIKRKRDYDRN